MSDDKVIMECFNDEYVQVRDTTTRLLGFIKMNLNVHGRRNVAGMPIRFLALPVICAEVGADLSKLPGFIPLDTPQIDLGPDPKTKVE